MATVHEDTEGKIRDLPIKAELKRLLEHAADQAGIAVVRVTSGGQAAKGSGGKRTGSTRHDHGWAADLQLLIDGRRALNFTDADDLPIISAFVTAAAALGANGIGAGIDYMGPRTLHVGFGTSPKDHTRLVWGAGGKSVNAPKWLKKAAERGWAKPASPALPQAAPAGKPIGRFVVAARDGVRLRGGPGLDFPHLRTIGAGTELTVLGLDGVNRDWARVDLNHDALIDGHLHAAFLMPLGQASQDETDAPETDDVDEGADA